MDASLNVKRWVAAAVVVLGSVVPSASRAAPLPLGEQPYEYIVLDQDVRDTLRQFGANNGLRIVLSDAVQGRVRGRLGLLTPRAFLDRLASDFGLDWFYDGFTLYLTAVSEGVNRLVSLGTATPPQLEEALQALGIADPRFSVRPLPGQNVVAVAGPPRFVEMVQQAAAALAAGVEPKSQPAHPIPISPKATPAKPSVTVYRGSQEQQVSVPER